MCGIAGICHLNRPRDISLDALKLMAGAQHHRGPDEAGIYIDDRVGLAHSRLSIIDLAGGSQPIHNEDKSLWIVYNGEIFNYPELKENLLKRGHRFYTTSDTEVLLHLFEEKGPACLNELNGQFGFAIWNAKDNELFLARDRMGIRPLHYTIHDGRLIFASEIKAIFTLPEIKRQIDPIAMDQISTFWTTLPGRTAFEGINELPSGHFLHVRDGQINVKKYWDIPFYPRDEQVTDSPDDIAANIDDLLNDAIRIRLRADVTVGCYLSGGLDSSGITSRVLNNFNSSVRSFGIRFEEKDFDEGIHQNLMVDHLQVDHKEIVATNEMIGAIFPDVIRQAEKPILRTAPAPLFLLSRLVNQSGLKVVLTGEGADEFFGGYNILREAKVRQFWARQPDSTSRPDLFAQLYPYIFKNPRLKKTLQAFFARGLDEPDNPLFSHLIRWGNTRKIGTFFSAELKESIGDYNGFDELVEQLPAAFESWDSMSRAQYLEAGIFLSNYLLSSQGDRMAMGNSVEIRLPYLDPRIMDYMGKVPAKWKILGLDEKHILKKVFAKDLPKEILDRSKHPYRAPIAETLLNSNGSYIEHVISPDQLKKAGLFEQATVQKLLLKIRRSSQPNEIDNMALTAVVSSQILYDQYIGNDPAREIAPAKVNVLIDRRNVKI